VLFAIIGCKSNKLEYLVYPDYDVVVTKFFSEYSTNDLKKAEQLKFAKKPTGWHVIIIDYSSTPKITKDELFWDKKNETFNKINFQSLVNQLENQEQLSFYLNDFQKKFYRILQFSISP